MTRRGPADRWGPVAQSLHWAIVVLIVVMAYLGLTMVDLPNTPRKVEVYALHKSIGLALLALVVVRLLWRLYAGAPAPLPAPRWQRWLAHGTHFGLYVLLLAMPLSGWIANAASGFPLRWFGLFRVPQPIAADEALYDLTRDVHEWLFWLLVVLALAHVFAALWHHLFLGDATLSRMLPRRRPAPPVPVREESR
jgi:cytochrome b561